MAGEARVCGWTANSASPEEVSVSLVTCVQFDYYQYD